MKRETNFVFIILFFLKVNDILQGLMLNAPEIQERIRQVFESEMILGLAKDPKVPSSLQMENTFLPELCDGSGTSNSV